MSVFANCFCIIILATTTEDWRLQFKVHRYNLGPQPLLTCNRLLGGILILFFRSPVFSDLVFTFGLVKKKKICEAFE